MKTHWVILIVLIVIGSLIIGGSYLFFHVGTSFISSFDGNNSKSNYTHIVKDYYLFNAERSICLYLGDRYERVTANVDSLSWDTSEIVGYSRGKYFRINVGTEQMEYYSLRDSFNFFVPTIPNQKLNYPPALK